MKKILFLLVSSVFICFSSCSNDDKLSLPDIEVNFANAETGIGNDSISGEVVVNLSRQAAVDVNIDISIMESDSIIYGKDYETTPASENKIVKLVIPAGSLNASIKVKKVNQQKLTIADSIDFTISSIPVIEGIVIGKRAKTSFFFGEISSKGDFLTLNGRVDSNDHQNSVYVDFNRNTQTFVDRKSWNLGFYGGDDFRVILNAAYATTAVSSGKTDIKAVTLADANAAYNIGLSPTSFVEPLSFDAVDTFDGSLSGTVFSQISEDSSKNAVYFVAVEDNKDNRNDWYKVKVDRSGNGYKVQYAKVGDSDIKTVQIDKNNAYNFSFLSFDKAAIVNVEPEAKAWSIMWSYYTIGIWDRPYFAQDIVAINNIGGAQAARVLVSESVTYGSFTKANLASVEFSSDRDAIGSDWRNTSSFGGAKTGVYSDRFYVVKDPNGNYYKLRFLKMGMNNDGAVRGRPVIEYALLK